MTAAASTLWEVVRNEGLAAELAEFASPAGPSARDLVNAIRDLVRALAGWEVVPGDAKTEVDWLDRRVRLARAPANDRERRAEVMWAVAVIIEESVDG